MRSCKDLASMVDGNMWELKLSRPILTRKPNYGISAVIPCRPTSGWQAGLAESKLSKLATRVGGSEAQHATAELGDTTIEIQASLPWKLRTIRIDVKL